MSHVMKKWLKEIVGSIADESESTLAECIEGMDKKIDELCDEIDELKDEVSALEDERDEKERLECEVDHLRGRVASADQIVRAFGDPEDSGHEGFVMKMADFLFTQRGVPCRLFTDTGEEVERYAVERDMKALFHEAGKA